MAQDHLILHTNDCLITANTILRNSLDRGYIQEFNNCSSLKDRIVFLVDSVEAATGFSGFDAYFTTLLELDALFLNQDRHLNNIALLHTDSGYKPCPIFDCGASFLLEFNLYRPDIETRAFLSKAQCLPFKFSFTRTVHTAQSLYGKQLKIDFLRSDIESLLDTYLDYYPKPFRYLLKDRVMTVLLVQKKSCFKRFQVFVPPPVDKPPFFAYYNKNKGSVYPFGKSEQH